MGVIIIAIDTESYQRDKDTGELRPVLDARKFTIGCAMTDRGDTKFFYTPEEMFVWLTNMIEKNAKYKRRTYIYAHNMEYDWYAIANKHLINKYMKYILFKPFLGVWDDKGYFLDTMAFYRCSLEKVGEMLEFPKLKMPEKIEKAEDLKDYVERDTRIVLEAVLGLKKRLEILGFRPRKMLTSGQVAMTCFLSYCRKNYIDNTFCDFDNVSRIKHVVKTNYPDLIRQAYRGGDNQAMRTGKFKNATMIDINGLYADNMCKMKFPDLRSEIYTAKPNIYLFKKYLMSYIGVAQVRIKAPSTTHPVLPIRYGGFQVFASNTELRGTWTFMEINQAIKEGYELLDVDWCIRWTELKKDKEKFNPLREFIKEIYSLERNSESAEEKAPIKMLRNNLSGKFAQNRMNKDYKLVNREEAMKYVEDGYKTKSKYLNKYIMVKETDLYNPSYTNPIISVLITAMGRLRMHEEEKKIPYEDRLYKDTDSLIFIDNDGETLKKFEIGKELGQWKVEEIQQNCKILGEKRYYIGNNVKFSGLHSKDKTIDVIENEENIKVKRMYGLRSAMESGNWDRVGSFSEIEIETETHCKNMLPIPEKIDEVIINDKN